jgi:hypothetical protein
MGMCYRIKEIVVAAGTSHNTPVYNHSVIYPLNLAPSLLRPKKSVERFSQKKHVSFQSFSVFRIFKAAAARYAFQRQPAAVHVRRLSGVRIPVHHLA